MAPWAHLFHSSWCCRCLGRYRVSYFHLFDEKLQPTLFCTNSSLEANDSLIDVRHLPIISQGNQNDRVTCHTKILFAKNPGESLLVLGIFPIAVTNSNARVRVSGEVCSPTIISTPFWIGTGFMKCVERTLCSAPLAEAAIFVIAIEDVFVAKTASWGQICANLEKMSNLREGIS